MNPLTRVVLLVPLLALSGCFTGPYYMANEIYPGAHQPHIRLTRFTLLNWFAEEPEDETNYIAPIQLESATGAQPARVKLGTPCRFNNDPWHESSSFIPVAGSKLWLELIEREPWEIRAIVRNDDGSQVCRLTSFVNHTCGAKTAAYAVSRSGRYLLVADTQKVTLWDVAHQRLLESDTGPLLAVRAFLASNRGSEGKWWLTDDLHYVVIEPDQDVKNYCGNYANSDPMYMPVGGIQVNVAQRGLIYDRVTHQCETFPADIDRKRALDAESVNGKLQILYGREFLNEEFIVADMAGQPMPTRGSGGLTGSEFRRWLPDQNEIWSLAGTASSWHGDQTPKSEAVIRRWNYALGTVQDYQLTVKDIKAALAHAP